jgi:hypothetical protein
VHSAKHYLSFWRKIVKFNNNQFTKLTINRFEAIYQLLLSSDTQKKSERIFLVIAILSFIIHLSIILLVNFGIVDSGSASDFFKNPITAIYTPFSFILVYEVYLLIYFLPRSLTTYVNKQYEIILLIIMRRLFKDLGKLEISSDWFSIKNDLQFTYDIATSLLLFFLIYLFYIQSRKKHEIIPDRSQYREGTDRYIGLKKIIASCLVPIVILLAGYSFISWLLDSINAFGQSGESFKNINNIFFEQFFSLLIIVDVLLLLTSFFYTDKFHNVIRNSGFIISTILLRISFTVEGLLNNLLVIVAVIFGLVILVIHNKFEEKIYAEKS